MTGTKQALRRWELALLVGMAAAVLWGAWSLHSQQALADRVVRLHILANSDSEEDQALKLKVRDVVLERATELLRESGSRSDAERLLREELPRLQTMAEQTVQEQGYAYPVTARLEEAAFPTREYDGFRLPAGEYLALRVVIGDGAGHNWWCVVFPPLCTQASSDLAQTAMADGMTEEDVRLMKEDGGYVLKFKSIEIWENLKSRFS